ncbi:MAG: polysaccharide biosynthesis/export family protein [Planctomycetaceae bacterium]|nr:polysaccharide biosynthesis/export family protein [Planctomycetaceae bacterium]
MRREFLILAAAVTGLVGCVQTQYTASSLPNHLVAKPIRDYSTLDLARFASSDSGSDVIRPGDRLSVTLDPGTLNKDSVLAWTVSVDGQGETSLPNIGPVKLAGLTQAQAEKAIVQTSLERDVFLTPVVDVDVKERKEYSILVTGAVTTPGPVTITDESVSLADVLVRAGGPTSDASGNVFVSAARSQPAEPENLPENALRAVSSTRVLPASVNLDRTSGDELGHLQVVDGAVVHVEPLEPRPIQVVGVIRNQSVKVPAGQNVHLLDALTLAGGQTYSNWISDKVTIIRETPDGKGTVRIKGSIRKAKEDARENILLAPYDIVSVEENLLTFTLSTLSGLFGAAFNASRIAGP